MENLKEIAKQIEEKTEKDKFGRFLEVKVKEEDGDIWLIFNRDYEEWDTILPKEEARKFLEGILFGIELKTKLVKEKQEEKKEYTIECNEKIRVKARNKQDARYEFEERMFEATGGCYQKALENLIDMFKVTEKH